MLNFVVNEDRCIKCGMCVAECPPQCIVMENDAFPSIPEEARCKRCQHCLAICPTGAISILGVDPDKSLELKYELPTAHSMETLIKGRRSTRRYKKRALDAGIIKKLLDTAWHAPTAVNAQSVLFTATMNVDTTDALHKEIYARLETLLEGRAPEDDTIPLQYVRMAYTAYTEHGVDVLLRGAPHILIASALKTASQPKEDCLIALTTFDLLAQTMGVGTLWNGILKWCLKDFFPELATQLGVPEDHEIGYTMVFGRPLAQYLRTVQRTPAGMNLVDSFNA